MLKLVEKFKYTVIVPIVIILIGAIAFGVNGGFEQDVDFAGGMTMYVDMGAEVDLDELSKFVESNTPENVNPIVQKSDGNQVIIKTLPVDTEIRDALQTAILTQYELEDTAILQVDNVSATVGDELKRQAFMATVIAAILMLLYIAIRFEFRTGFAAVVCLLHDILIMLTVYAVFRIPVNSNFIAAILTIVGYSINNTIVVFDRIRENYAKNKRAAFADIVNQSVKQTLTRSINTTITTLLPVIMLFIFGVTSIRQFTIPLMVGLLAGTYSSVLLAGPLWAFMKNAQANRKKKKLQHGR
ncbi:MAG: protein translocase subunit SecF [Ruminococcaceae bacterium]|nr:protein translocase subunit SecF [Oscillospiraceae bacterium]